MTPTDTVVSEERLTYADLREANIARQAAWCPDQVPDLSFRGNELAGETGEVCNVIKKLERERLGWRGSRDTVEHLAEELADVVICADLCALSAGIDLNEAVAAKFNATSEKVGLPHRLTTPSLPPRSGGVVVKGLEWEGDRSKSVVGTYATVRTPDGYAVTFDGEEIAHIGHNSVSAFEGARNAAQSHAQADYEARIRSTLADPIPEAPADEEVEGLSLEKAVRDAHKTLMNTLDRDFGLWSSPAFAKAREAVYPLWKRLDETLAALRRSTETDKPGVREGAATDGFAASDFADVAARMVKFDLDTDQYQAVMSNCFNVILAALNRAASQAPAAIRALSASTLTEEQPVAAIDAIMEASAMTANSGSGQFWIKIAFPTLAKMQAAHNALVKALPRARTESPND